MEIRRVRTIDDIVFEQENESITLHKGSIFTVETVLEKGIILCSEEGERIMIDLESFENGFEALG